MKHAIALGFVAWLSACAGAPPSTHTPQQNQQAELDATNAEIATLAKRLAELDAAKKAATAMNPRSLNSVYEMEIKPEKFAEYLKAGQEYAERVRKIPGVELYILVVDPKKPNTLVWIERYADEQGLANYEEQSGVKAASAKYTPMVKHFFFRIRNAHEATE